jgi:hypothetical protein
MKRECALSRNNAFIRRLFSFLWRETQGGTTQIQYSTGEPHREVVIHTIPWSHSLEMDEQI